MSSLTTFHWGLSRIICTLILAWTSLTLTVRVFCEAESPPVRDTIYGKIQGYVHNLKDGRKVERFLGVPYATPPLGERRFELPIPPSRWTNTRKTNKVSAACMQHLLDQAYIRDHDPTYSGHMSEDCLYLNIYIPKREGSSSRALPVLVHVHGGSNEVGMGAMLHGDVLASYGEIVVVTFNYRVGAFGFLRVPQLDISGNFGLYDQVMAFRWVSENIANFDGDPSKVTIQGHSAGSIDVALHVLSPVSKGLFRYAIMQSGAPTAYWAVLPDSNPEDTSRGALHHVLDLECQFKDKMKALACLKRIDATRISTKVYNHADGFYIFAPAVDGVILVDDPQTLLSGMSLRMKENVNAESLMLGVVKDEGSLTAEVIMRNQRSRRREDLSDEDSRFQIPDTFDDQLFKNFPLSITDRYKNVKDFPALAYFVYKPWSDPNNVTANYMALSDLTGDVTFTAPTIQSADYFSAINNTDVYIYKFEHRSTRSVYPNWMGVPHGDDLFYVFGCPIEGHPVRNYTALDRLVSLALIDMWTNFVKSGRLSLNNETPNIRPYTENKSYVSISSNATDIVISNQQRMRARFMAFWNDLVPYMESRPSETPDKSKREVITWALAISLCVTIAVGLAVILCLCCKGRSQKLLLKQSGKRECGVMLS